MNNEIVQDWQKEGINLGAPATFQEIQDCEQAIEFNFPEDFKYFYSCLCNGFKNWEMDSKLLSLWPLEAITANYLLQIASSFDNDYVAFCDYLANSSQIGFLKSKPGIYKDYDKSLICNSFEEFIEHWRRESHEYF